MTNIAPSSDTAEIQIRSILSLTLTLTLNLTLTLTLFEGDDPHVRCDGLELGLGVKVRGKG